VKVLAADIGGTKTELALVTVDEHGYQVEASARYSNADFSDFASILKDYLSACPTSVEHAGFAVAGPVLNQQSRLTNLDWQLDASELQTAFKFKSATLLNDLEGLGWGIGIIPESNYISLQDGHKQPGNKAVIAAGTGLGEAILYCDENGCTPFATEGGHCDFAAESAADSALRLYLNKQHEHVSWEHIVSGQGLINLYEFLLQQADIMQPTWFQDSDNADLAAMISSRAGEGSDPICVETLRMFVHHYGREAGNLALKANALGGIFLGGGITGKILPALQKPDFIQAFLRKGRMSKLLQSIPVKIITDQHAALKGIAHYVVHQINH
jgi:glucokinase